MLQVIVVKTNSYFMLIIIRQYFVYDMVYSSIRIQVHAADEKDLVRLKQLK